jgi:hypothetical protein
MEAAGGDSSAISDSKIQSDSIEFERNLDKLKTSLEEEDERLARLEEKRLKILNELEEMYCDIQEEKLQYRKIIDLLVEERDNMAHEFLESQVPGTSTMSLFEETKTVIEDTEENVDIDVAIEKIRCDLLENYVSTSKDYLKTAKSFFKPSKSSEGSS